MKAQPLVLRISCILITLLNSTAYSIEANFLPHFKHFNIDNGMSQNSVLCIMQDSKGFMWFGTKDGLNRYDGVQFKLFSSENTNFQIQDCIINSLYEDRNGRIWIGTDKGLSIYNSESESIQNLDNFSGKICGIKGRVRSVIIDKNDIVWFIEEFKGVYSFNPDNNQIKQINSKNNPNILNPSSLYESKDGTIWVGTMNNGVFYYDANSETLKPFQSQDIDCFNIQTEAMIETDQGFYFGTFNKGLLKVNRETKNISHILLKDLHGDLIRIHSLLHTDTNEIWIGSETGLYIFNEETFSYKHVSQSYTDRSALSDNAIYSFCKDRDGGLWLGTYFGGVNYYPSQHTPFNKYYPLDKNNSISGKAVREFCEDNEGFIWIGTEDAGLNRFNPETGKFNQNKRLDKNSKYTNIHALQIDGNKLWIGTYTDGLYLMNLSNQEMKHYEEDKAPREVFSLLKDSNGTIWLGTFQGAFTYNSSTDSFDKVEDIGEHFIYDMKEDHNGNIWFAAISLGVICYNTTTKNITTYKNDPDDINSISSKIIGIYVDKKNQVWFCSEGQGFYQFKRDTQEFKRYSITDGLPSNVVYYITEDVSGYLWFGTNRGLVCFNPEDEEMKIYTLENGLICNQFNYKSAFTAKNGTIYMGTINGYISFNPLLFKKNNMSFTPILTGFQIFNEEVPIGKGFPLKKSISYTENIVLNYQQNTLSFDFASLNYNSSESHTYIYRLEGLDADWITLRKNQKITYSNLFPGEYQLRIKALQGNNECKLGIIIKPPFWLSMYAYIFYIILLIFLTYIILHHLSIRLQKRHKKEIELLEAEKEKEAYDAKISFFTNVAHEIRTPLSLIKGPLEHILYENRIDKEVREDLLVMQRNSNRLLSLINQLLDFRKTESGKFDVTFQRQELIVVLEEIYDRFSLTFRQKGITFEFIRPEIQVFADIDVEAFTKIISNLFTNAMKHCKSFIKLELIAEVPNENFFVIKMRNDGDIIPEQLFDTVFEPFFQINTINGENMKTGTGIGLSLSKSLAELHYGKLYVEKELDKYNTFVLELPKHQTRTIVNRISNEEKEPETQLVPLFADKVEKYSILVIEDNEEMQEFIRKHLSKKYIIYSTSDGKEALKIIEKEHLDLIISDIAMPKMDGFELLRNIKSDIKYSHIPIILLTALTNLQSKIEGIELGADAYIEKPFSMNILSVQITNLLERRKKLRDSFVNSPYLHTGTITMTKADEEFMEKVNKIIQKNIENIEFNIDYLTGAMNTSRSSLLRKIKALSGLTINEYIKLIRLKKATELLQEGKFRINEICFLTGFNSSSYFAKCFQKQFGILPKEFINSIKNEKEVS